MSQRVHAGFFLRGIRTAASVSGRLDATTLDAVWRRCCTADAEASFELSPRKLPNDPVLLAAVNTLVRGLPTFPSLEMERRLSGIFSRLELREDASGGVSTAPAAGDPAFGSLVVDALLAAAPLPDPADTASKTARTKPAAAAGEALLASEAGREALQLVLSPIAAARVARILFAALLAGTLDLTVGSWNIVVIERDVPGAAMGLGEFRRLLSNMLALEGKGRRMPDIHLHVLPSPAFVASPLHEGDGVSLLQSKAALPACDLLLDVAVLQGAKGVATPQGATPPHRVSLRTSSAADDGPRREFLIGEYRPYPGLFAGVGKVPDPGMLAALNGFIADCFRITSLSDEQLRLFDLVLRCRPFLAALPSAAGKSVVAHAAALFFPALSVVAVPLASLAEDQCEQLLERGIDALSCIHEGMGSDDRQRARETFGARASLLLFLSAETYNSDELDTLFERLQSEKVPIAQCVVDEAHTMSEWGHDFRIGMTGIPAFFSRRLEAGKQKNVPFRLLTSCSGRDVVTDLRSQLADAGCALAVDETVLVPDAPRPWQHFACERFAHRAATAPDALRERQASIPDLLRRQGQAAAALAGDAGNSSTVLYAPFASGLLGVTNRYDPGETEAAIDQTLADAGLSPLLFIGKEDGQAQVGRQIIVDSSRQRRLFRLGNHDLLLATTAYGIGTNKDDIRATVHLLPPSSVGRLLQECGRGGRDGRPVLHTVVYGGEAGEAVSPDMLPGYEALRSAHEVAGFRHLSTLAGDAARERQITYDLLREISFPEDSNCNRIAAMVAMEFGLDVRIAYWQRNLDERMYAYHAGSAMGHVDLVSQQRFVDNGYPDRELAEHVLAYAHRFGLEEAGSEHGLSAWVAATFPSDVEDGLQRQLDDFEPGAEFTLRIGFENDREALLTQMHQLLWRQAEIEIPRKLLSGIHAANWSMFRREVCSRAADDRLFDRLDAGIERRLVEVYNRIRLRGDTERFMLRLRQLGLLRQHVVHPSSRRFSLRLVARGDHEIMETLERFLSQRIPRALARSAVARIEEYPGESTLERALFLLIDHAVEARHDRAAARARTMLRCCAVGSSAGSDAFRDAVTRAERARFALPWYLPELLQRHADRLQLLDEAVALLETVSDGSVLENAAHLSASCDLLASAFPDEAGLELLRSFALLLLADSKGVKEARQRFAGAFGLAASASGVEGERYLAAVETREEMLRRMFGDDETPYILSLLHDEVKRVKGKPIPIPESRQTTPKAGDKGPKIATAGQRSVPDQNLAVTADSPGIATGKTTRAQSPGNKAAAEKAAAEKAAAEKMAAQKAAAGKAAAEKAAAEKAAAEKAAAEKAAAEKAAAEKAAAEKAAAEKAAAEKAAAEKAAAEKAAAEKAAAERKAKIAREGEQQREQERLARLAELERGTPANEDTILAELESMLSEMDGVNRGTGGQPGAERAARDDRTPERASARTASSHDADIAESGADPELLRHLKWLKSFNNNFLKRYES